MSRMLIIVLLCLANSRLFSEITKSDFPSYTIKGIQYLIPVDNEEIAKKNLSIHIDARVPGFSTILTFTGKKRTIPPQRQAKLDLLKKMANFQRLISLYETEVEVTQDGKIYWLPVQKGSEAPFFEQIKQGNEFNALIRYVGCCYTNDLKQMNENRLYFLIGFDFELEPRRQKSKCFSDKILGFKLGMPLKDALLQASKKYGEPIITKNASGGILMQFALDGARSARLYIGSATADYNRKVYLLQVSGTKLKTPLFDDVRLGDTLDAIKNLDRTQLKEEGPGVDQKTIFENGSPCSVQTTNDQITSVQILEDFNFLTD